MIDDYKYVENRAKISAMVDLKVKLLEFQKQGYIIPDLIFEMVNEKIKQYGQEI